MITKVIEKSPSFFKINESEVRDKIIVLLYKI